VRELFASCFCFCVGTSEGAFVGASPELLVRRSGAVAATVALAGSTRRSADPAVDDHLGERLLRSAKDRSEHAIVARRIERALRPHSVWVSSEAEPQLVKVANIQHLATPIHAQLAEPRSAIELAGLLHPTPAVGGEPAREALATIAERVTQTADMIRQIAVAAEQQSVATQQIAGDLENVAKVSKDSAGGASESAKASHDLSLLATELQSIVGGFKIADKPRG
jgi:hypothetical protein